MRSAYIQPFGVWIFGAVLLLAFAAEAGALEDPSDLYTATAVITGTYESEKQRGFAECFEQVLVKVSGDPGLAGQPAVLDLATRAEGFVQDYELQDRMAGLPLHDEQGTRDRPHLLTVTFSQSEIDSMLRELGREPWLDRPAITLAMVIDNSTARFMLTRESELGASQRDALREIGRKLGLELVFPDEKDLAGLPFSQPVSDAAGRGDVDEMRRALGGEVLLTGTMEWDERGFRWSAQWQLVADDLSKGWETEGVAFDAVFRKTLEHTMWLLSSKARE